jgi:hypothetical protein
LATRLLSHFSLSWCLLKTKNTISQPSTPTVSDSHLNSIRKNLTLFSEVLFQPQVKYILVQFREQCDLLTVWQPEADRYQLLGLLLLKTEIKPQHKYILLSPWPKILTLRAIQLLEI